MRCQEGLGDRGTHSVEQEGASKQHNVAGLRGGGNVPCRMPARLHRGGRFHKDKAEELDEVRLTPAYVASPAAGVDGARGWLRATLLGALSIVSPACGDELPVVARGRYVELATDRDDPVCAGTVTHIDRFIEGVFEVLGETPPDRVIVRYEWLANPNSPASADDRGDRVAVRSTLLVDEHELVHAGHLLAWPRSARFMEEGLAVLLHPQRRQQSLLNGLTRSGLDEILGDHVLDGSRYAAAWFIVSQIVRDHGMDGLRALWFRIPARASTQQVRAAYFELFDRPIDTLIEPWIDDGPGGPTPVDRVSCGYTLCTGESGAWAGPRWTGAAPAGCEDDSHAVGPDDRAYDVAAGAVWREYMVDLEYGIDPPRVSDGIVAMVVPCGLVCPQWYPVDYRPGSMSGVGGVGPFRVEVRTELELLPTDTPGSVEFEYAR
jgi:hypothetical protein